MTLKKQILCLYIALELERARVILLILTFFMDKKIEA